MTRESNLWTLFKEAMPSSWHAVRIENCVEIGTPDVNLCVPYGQEEGCGDGAGTGRGYWIELKVQEAPKRAKTLFKCEHFTMEQRQWLVDRCRAGGRAYLLLQAGSSYLWIRGDIAAVWLGGCTLTELVDKSEWHGGSLGGLVEYLAS